MCVLLLCTDQWYCYYCFCSLTNDDYYYCYTGKLHREQMLLQERLAREQETARLKTLNKASSVISSYMYRYKLRMHYYKLWRTRVKTESAGKKQSYCTEILTLLL